MQLLGDLGAWGSKETISFPHWEIGSDKTHNNIRQTLKYCAARFIPRCMSNYTDAHFHWRDSWHDSADMQASPAEEEPWTLNAVDGLLFVLQVADVRQRTAQQEARCGAGELLPLHTPFAFLLAHPSITVPLSSQTDRRPPSLFPLQGYGAASLFLTHSLVMTFIWKGHNISSNTCRVNFVVRQTRFFSPSYKSQLPTGMAAG